MPNSSSTAMIGCKTGTSRVPTVGGDGVSAVTFSLATVTHDLLGDEHDHLGRNVAAHHANPLFVVPGLSLAGSLATATPVA